VICSQFRLGQQSCLKGGTLSHCLTHLSDSDKDQRLWLSLCLAELWKGYSEAKLNAMRFFSFFFHFYY